MAPAAPRDEDADLIAAAAAGSAGGRSSSSSKGGSGSAAATESLARSNLLRLETAELVREGALLVSPAENRRGGEARWAPSARRYVEAVREAVTGLGGATLGPEAAAFPPAEGDGRRRRGGSTGCRWRATSTSRRRGAPRGETPAPGGPFPSPAGSRSTSCPAGRSGPTAARAWPPGTPTAASSRSWTSPCCSKEATEGSSGGRTT
ncbi:hypothetical protein THAOC_21664 [Thalassiosira oceanica]|uniref:Uncharacterized protein n=1 Tax=Thalassiosira oceanica TaxID=159749 RepID=K0RYZ2_THAOC|nr:hypothetical protein THAOC_21664 [Thalassiosira oceanica]|eukprot:EJK58230.1 hypothetical protein THAOC_21664 [Thalassiosira oceanica]